MRQPIYVGVLSQEEREVLEAGLRSSEAFRVRLCQILLSSSSGKRAREIAEELLCDDQRVRHAIYAFHAKGLAALTPGSSRPHKIQDAFDQEHAKSLKEMLHLRS